MADNADPNQRGPEAGPVMEPLPLPSISSVLTVSEHLITKRVRNVREAELLGQTTATANRFESAVSGYEVLALKLAALKEQWDAAWLSGEPQLTSRIPLIGQAMSEQNVARGRLIKQIEDLVSSLQQQGAALLQFADMHQSYARELTAEGLGKLAAEKMLLCNIEQELASRITAICTGGGLRTLSPMSNFVHALESPSEQTAAETASPAAPQPRSEPGPNVPRTESEKVPGVAPPGAGKEGKQAAGGSSPGLEHAELEFSRVQPGFEGEVLNGINAERTEERERNGGLDAAPEKAQHSAGALLEPPRDTLTAGKETDAGPRLDEAGVQLEAPRLGKRLREVNVEQGVAKVPRLDGDSRRGHLPCSDRIDSPHTGEQLIGASGKQVPFSSNLAAAFQLEEGLDESGSKGTRGSDEPGARDSGGVSKKARGSDERVPSEEGSQSQGGHKRSIPLAAQCSQDEKDPFLTPRERQLLTDEKLTPPSTSSPLTCTQSPRGPGESTPGSSTGNAGTGRQAATDRGASPGKWPLQNSGPSEEEARLEKEERSGCRPGLETNEKVLGSLSPPSPVEPVQAASPSATMRGDSPSPNRSPSKRQGALQGSQNTPGTSASPEKAGVNGGVFRSPSQAAFQLRLSSSSSSPSKTPGSEKLSQTGGHLDQSQHDPSQSEKDRRCLVSGKQEGYRGTRLTLFETKDEAGPPDSPIAEGGNAFNKHPGDANPQGTGTEELVTRVADKATSALTSQGVPRALPSIQQTDETQVDQTDGLLIPERPVPSGRVLHEECGPDGEERHRPSLAGGFEPPLTYTGVWAHEPHWRETQSQAFTDERSQSHSGAGSEDPAAERGRVPDSEEQPSDSSDRGVHPGPTPPPSCPTSSPDDPPEKHGGLHSGASSPPSGPTSSPEDFPGRPGGVGVGTNVAPASPVSSLADPSGERAHKRTGNESQQYADQQKQGTPIGTEVVPGASLEKPDASDSGTTELVPERESLEEETEEEEDARDAATCQQETAPVVSPCRASESSAIMGSQPLSQSRVC